MRQMARSRDLFVMDVSGACCLKSKPLFNEKRRRCKMVKYQNMDIILSYKEPSPGWFPLSRPVNRFFHNQLLDKQQEEYPGGSIRWDHCRVIFTSVIQDTPIDLVGEATFPLAHVVPLEQWMLDPDYSTVYRCRLPIVNPVGAFKEALSLSGTLYDVGQLFAMYTGFRRFDWGRRNLVCSVYARHLLQVATGMGFTAFGAPSLNETLPAFFANFPSLFSPVES
jgi:hypothetical protein